MAVAGSAACIWARLALMLTLASIDGRLWAEGGTLTTGLYTKVMLGPRVGGGGGVAGTRTGAEAEAEAEEGPRPVCLDGSPGAFYWRAGSGTGAHKFYAHFEGDSNGARGAVYLWWHH